MGVSNTHKAIRDQLLALQKRLADRGQLMAAGWAGFRAMVIPASASQAQVDEMQIAFYAGAQHFYTSILGVMDDGEAVTEADMARMTRAVAELDAFAVKAGIGRMQPMGRG